jgi:hypothetical protein
VRHDFLQQVDVAGIECFLHRTAMDVEKPVGAVGRPGDCRRGRDTYRAACTILAKAHDGGTRRRLPLSAFGHKTGNYTVLRDLGSPNFQTNSAAKLGDIFANQRKQGLDFSAVAVLEPQLTLLPRIEPSGMLHMAGFFPSVPMQLNFELLFEPVNRQWKIFGVSVNLTPGGPQAPETPVEVQPKPTDPGPPPDAPSIAVQPKTETKPVKP